MELESRSNSIHALNTVMMWLVSVTILMLILPWKDISPEFGQKVEANRLYLYIALIFEISNFVSQFIISFFANMHAKKVIKIRSEQMEHTVASLDFSERALLREFVLQRKSVLRLPLSEPTVEGLIENKILKAVGTRDENEKTPVIISRFARPFITYKAIGLSRGKMTEDQISQIMDARPEYAKPKADMPKVYRAGVSIKAA